MELIKKYVGLQLSRAMKAKDVGQKEIADHLEIDQSNVSRWLKGHTLPTDENFAETCHFLKMKPEQILFPETHGASKNELIGAVVSVLPALEQDEMAAILETILDIRPDLAPAIRTAKGF